MAPIGQLASPENHPATSQNPNISDHIPKENIQLHICICLQLVAELIATYMLVFVRAGLAALAASDERRVSKLGASIAGGLIITVMIYAVGHISGVHMNRAVTLAFAAVRHFPWKQVPIYAVAQLPGSISASFTLSVLLHPIKQLGTTSASGSEIQALIAEIIMTFSMVFIASAVATDTKAAGELAGIAVGSAVCITSIFAGWVSMNPARTIGPAITSAYYKGIWVYVVGPVIGALLGSWSYSFIRVSDNPIQAVSPPSFASKLRRIKSDSNGQPTFKGPLDSA
ncbi:aquaporin NIP2-1-like [Pyrus ussuriensis x Pyrus communis]|uniref:Aquaporin NIP2-1-like n=1 Tax=Pyrus ussuriensis x Pyrus communis TaxID=2448454 RepID=A0A5N5GEH2_9ROSA|nr:aquaporin NIP2-1-like [Pyrus ussuriensis x Pyrus communis]